MADHRDKRREDQRSAYKSVRHRTARVQRQRRATKSVHKDKREENREYCSGQCSCDHWAQTGIKHQPHELTRVGAESRANSELASPPGHRIPHCSIDSEQGQETRYASYKQQHLADYPSLLGVVIHLRTQMDYNAEQGWVIGKMLLFVAGVAGFLALLGIYGAVGYSVTRRTREFGIRAALGANPRELMRLVFNSGLRPVIAGTLAGTIFAVLFSFILVNALRRAPLPLNPTSPVSYGLVCASLVFAALVAMIGHARRAARIQPLVALREE